MSTTNCDVWGTKNATRQKQTAKPIYASGRRNRVAIFVDGANLFYATSAMEIQIEHRKFLRYITADRFLAGAFFYTGFNPLNTRERAFLLQMKHEGYEVIEKDLIQRSNGSRKANLDVEIALDMVIKAYDGSYDTAVLVSGDGDFTYAVDTVKSRNIRVEVIGLYSMTSNTLINSADRYTDLAIIKNKICKQRQAKTVPRSSLGLTYSNRLQTV